MTEAEVRRQTRRIVAIVWIPLLVAGVIGVGWATHVIPIGGDDCSEHPPLPTPAGPGWAGLHDAPMTAGGRFVTAWTGDELVVFGGDAGVVRESCPTNDGAAYDPDTGTWRRIADPPFDPLFQPNGIWTPSGLFVIGRPCGSQGERTDSSYPACRPGGVAAATYDADADAWQSVELDADVVAGLDLERDDAFLYVLGWDGEHVVLRAEDRLLAFDPVTAEWARWPAPPADYFDGLCVVDGGVVAIDLFRPDIIVDEVEAREDTSPLAIVSRAGGPWSAPISAGGGATSTGGGALCAGDLAIVDEVRFDARAARWEPAALPPAEIGHPFDGQVVWTGTELLEVDHNRIASYSPDTDTWSVLGETPATTSWHAVWTGDALVYEDDGFTAVMITGSGSALPRSGS